MASRSLLSAFWTTIGKKFVVGLTGLALFLFVIGHLLGNLTLFLGPDAFNSYSHKLVSLGGLLYFVEIVLLAAFLFHMMLAVLVTLNNKSARPTGYQKLKSAGNPSRKTLSSTTMIYTGIFILIFTVIHLKTFKYGPGIEEGYRTPEGMRDLYRLVMETFRDPLYTFGYVAAMIFLGFHLRHGFWSAFQSLGVNHPRYSGLIYSVGVVLAIILAVGFLVIPLWVYFGGGA